MSADNREPDASREALEQPSPMKVVPMETTDNTALNMPVGTPRITETDAPADGAGLPPEAYCEYSEMERAFENAPDGVAPLEAVSWAGAEKAERFWKPKVAAAKAEVKRLELAHDGLYETLVKHTQAYEKQLEDEGRFRLQVSDAAMETGKKLEATQAEVKRLQDFTCGLYDNFKEAYLALEAALARYRELRAGEDGDGK